MTALPHCDELLRTYFDRWCSKADIVRRGFTICRPDMIRVPSLAGRTESEASPLTEQARQSVSEQLTTMLDAARADWPRYLSVSGGLDLGWIDTFDRHYDRERIAKLIEESDPVDFSNAYLVTCCEFGSALGHVMRSLQPRLLWHFEWPYWESAVFDPQTGYLIPVFHWAVGKMSEYGVEDGYVPKLRACLDIIEKQTAA